jgi:hypothetical protein
MLGAMKVSEIIPQEAFILTNISKPKLRRPPGLLADLQPARELEAYSRASL